jgi:type II secretion system protein N
VYIVFLMAAFAVLALVCFPGKNIAKALKEMNQIMPGLVFNTEDIRPDFPLGLACIRPQIALSRTLFLYPEDLRLRLAFASLFSPAKPLQISGTWHQGRLDGVLSGLPSCPPGFADLRVSVSGARFQKVAYDTDRFSLTAAFTLDGTVKTQTEDGSQVVTGSLVLNRVRCVMQDGPLKAAGITTFEFSRVNIDLTRKDPEGFAVTCRAKGGLADIDLNGKIKTKTAAGLDALVLDLQGYMRPAPEHAPAFAGMFPLARLFNSTRGIPIRITGPLASLRISQ